jgi:hypothetical protein
VLGAKGVGEIYRTDATSYLEVPAGYLPDGLAKVVGPLERFLPWLFGEGGVKIGPIPKGTPVNILSNLELRLDEANKVQNIEQDVKLVSLLLKIKKDLKELGVNASDADAIKVFANLKDPLLALSKCADFEVNRGHYFGSDRVPSIGGVPAPQGLSNADKEALIAFLKTF